MMIRLFIIMMMISFSATANTIVAAQELIGEAIIDNADNFDPDSKIEVKITKGKYALEDLIANDMELTNIEFDDERNNFTANLLVNEVVAQEVQGKFKHIIKIPAVNKKLRQNEIITAQNITYVEIDSKKLSRGYITDESELIGKSPVRTLFKNRPVLPKYISAPNIVKRKQAVTMVFESAVMQIQDSGVAMEDGGKGELIRVRNANSNTIIHARVIGENLVKVTSGTSILAGNF